MSPTELRDDLLRTLRREFYSGAHEKQFFQERPMLIRAITFPAKYLNDRAARLPGSRYKAILTTVIDTIKAKGNRGEINRFSVYFLHCVQQRMKFHGDEYYNDAKTFDGRATTTRPIAELVAGALKPARRGDGVDRTVDVLAETHRTLIHRARSKGKKPAAQERDLFAPCKTVAKPRQ